MDLTSMETPDYSKPFIIYRCPGDGKFTTCTDVSTTGNSICSGDITVTTWLNRPLAKMEVEERSTSYADYCRVVAQTIDNARKRNGKTVIVRSICGTFSRFAPLEMAAKYFAMFPEMFCFMFYHPDTGYWMGASPELLVEIIGNKAFTRALAGTRTACSDSEWDSKNKAEHDLVIEDITANIGLLGRHWSVAKGETGIFRYSGIEHLCTPITIEHSNQNIPIHSLIEALHPTAAVGGFPRKDALADIASLESRPRKFYAGIFSTGSFAYVLLRCVHFDTRRWCVYTGSGVTGFSVPDDEWNETKAKAYPLLSILNQYSI